MCMIILDILEALLILSVSLEALDDCLSYITCSGLVLSKIIGSG